jgi:hypothetical protein
MPANPGSDLLAQIRRLDSPLQMGLEGAVRRRAGNNLPLERRRIRRNESSSAREQVCQVLLITRPAETPVGVRHQRKGELCLPRSRTIVVTFCLLAGGLRATEADYKHWKVHLSRPFRLK